MASYAKGETKTEKKVTLDWLKGLQGAKKMCF